MQSAIVIVSYQGKEWLGKCLASCQNYAPDVPVYVVDNASTDASAELAARFAGVTVLRQEVNLGFAGGNNVGLRAAMKNGAEAIMLLNQDAVLTSGCLELLADYLENHNRVAAVQPAIFLPDGKVNSLGNSFHYLGFGEAGGNGLSLEEASRRLPWLKTGSEPPYLSGAAMLVRAAALRQVGLFYEELFMYHEDLELSLRLRTAGWRLAVLPAARVIHNYQPSRSLKQYYYMERNRFLVWNEIFSWRTRLVLLPVFLLSEIALLIMAANNGWIWEKLRAYAYFLRPASWFSLVFQRRRWLKLRRVIDKELLSLASARIEYQAGQIGGLTRFIWNPLSTLAWALLKPLIRW